MLKMIDTFSGIGGFSLAAGWTGGIETVQFVEREPFCQRILTKHWPTVPIHDDICTFTPPPQAQQTLLPEVFLVKTSPRLEKAPGWLAKDRGSFTNCSESFAWWDHATSSWKTSQQSLLGEWTPFLERWPRQGMMRSGRAYQRRLWVPAISGTGGGALPTPRTCSAMAAPVNSKGNLEGNRSPNLETVTGRMLFTPTASGSKNASLPPSQGNRNSLPGQMLRDGLAPTGEAMYLNPYFVEEMMGYPIGHTA